MHTHKGAQFRAARSPLCYNKPTHLMAQLPHTQASGRPDDNHLGPLRLPSFASWLSTCRCMVTLSSCVSASLTWNSTISALVSSLNCLKSWRAFLQTCCCLLSVVAHKPARTGCQPGLGCKGRSREGNQCPDICQVGGRKATQPTVKARQAGSLAE